MPPKKKHKTATSTRRTTSVIGAPCSLPDTGCLHTTRDIVAAFQMKQLENPDKLDVWCAEQLLPHIKAKWESANPRLKHSFIQDIAIRQKIIRGAERADEYDRKKLAAKSKAIFLKTIDKLFDILKCVCPIVYCSRVDCPKTQCCEGAHITCKCTTKIPVAELRFLKDQREKTGLLGGELKMCSVDKESTKAFMKHQERKQKDAEMKLKHKQKEEIRLQNEKVCPELVDEPDFDDDIMEDVSYDPDFDSVPGASSSSGRQQRTKLEAFVSELLRYGVSDRAAAAIHNALCRDYGLITDQKTQLVVDKNKIRREKDAYRRKQRTRQRKKLQARGGIKCLGTDGKRNKKTRVKEIQVRK